MVMGASGVIQGKYDQYTITSNLAKGGMGVVDLALNSKGQQVIVKTPLVEGDATDTMRAEKLKVESAILKDIASQAQQNSIVKYLDESTQNNVFHLITEKINGKTLLEEVGRTPIGEKVAITYITQILEALKYIHGKNIIHRDIKPQNIIIDPARGPILIDFGAAKHGWTQLGPGSATIMYTPGWSCLHQVRGELTSSCDLYSVGAVLFFMIVGKIPERFMDSHSRLKIKPNQIRTGISQKVSDLIVKAIDPDHKQITTADDMLAHLRNQVTASSTQPYLIIGGRHVQLKQDVDIGRQHAACDKSCHALGYQRPPSIPLPESGQFKFISKHHVRIWTDRNGYHWIQDLRSRNGTAISKQGQYRMMAPGIKERIYDNTNVALCYHKIKGPYQSFTFHGR